MATTKLPPIMTFQGSLNPDSPALKQTLICFDPGETTGVAVYKYGKLVDAGQLITKDIISGSLEINAYIAKHTPDLTLHDDNDNDNDNDEPEWRDDVHLVIEDYKVYGWKTEQHTWAALHTPKLIGSIVTLGVMYGIGNTMQMAQQAKQFCTDDKLEGWGLYKKGMRHARDAIRHGIYYLLFNKDHLTKN